MPRQHCAHAALLYTQIVGSSRPSPPPNLCVFWTSRRYPYSRPWRRARVGPFRRLWRRC